MNLVTIFGAGLLVGAALIVIVPEGMIVLVESMTPQHDHTSTDSTDHEHDNNHVIA